MCRYLRLGLAGAVTGFICDRLPHFGGFLGDLVDGEDIALSWLF